MSPTESRLERNRRRWQRRRRRHLVAMFLLIPLLVGAAILGINVVEVLGDGRDTAEPVDARRSIASRARTNARPLNQNRQRGNVPVMVPVSESYSVHDADMRTVDGKASDYARYYEPQSHVSPQVRWEVARLKRLAKQRSAQMIVLPNRGLKPSSLAVIDGVFRPSELEPSRRDPGHEYWEIERFYVELAPGEGLLPTGFPQVPEPGTGSMLCLGLTWIGAQRRARRLRQREAQHTAVA